MVSYLPYVQFLSSLITQSKNDVIVYIHSLLDSSSFFSSCRNWNYFANAIREFCLDSSVIAQSIWKYIVSSPSQTVASRCRDGSSESIENPCGSSTTATRRPSSVDPAAAVSDIRYGIDCQYVGIERSIL